METIQNAKIRYSFLGVDEEGTLYAQIGFETKGGYTVDTAKLTFLDVNFIKEILDTLEVRSWGDLGRKYAKIKIDDRKVVAIGHIVEDKWVNVRQ